MDRAAVSAAADHAQRRAAEAEAFANEAAGVAHRRLVAFADVMMDRDADRRVRRLQGLVAGVRRRRVTT